MNFDYECNKFRRKLIDFINEAQLPPTIILYIFNELSNELKTNMDANIAQAEAEIAETQTEPGEAESASEEEK